MQMKRILKIGLFIVTTSIFFAACANKPIEKNVQKSKTKTINNLLNDSFDYDENQKIYKISSAITSEDDANNLLAKFENFCTQNKGQLIGGAYYINKDYTKTHTNNKAGVCDVDSEPFFIIHQARQGSNIYYSVITDEGTMKIHYGKNKKQSFEIEPPVKESTEQIMQERKEIQRREAAREQKTKLLLSQKNQKTMTFFDSWRYSGSEASCSNRCYDINLRNNGFKTLKEALNNNWQLVSKIEETEITIDNNCTCSGSSVVLKK